jgi:hypothetical protein
MNGRWKSRRRASGSSSPSSAWLPPASPLAQCADRWGLDDQHPGRRWHHAWVIDIQRMSTSRTGNAGESQGPRLEARSTPPRWP